MKRVGTVSLFLLLLAASCQRQLVPAQYSFSEIRIDTLQPPNESLVQQIAPYKHGLDSLMNELLCVNETPLAKQRPCGSLNCLVADVMLQAARSAVKDSVDAAVINYGGLRISEWPAGAITVGKVYELLPFDNFLVVLPLRGDTLQQLLNATAAAGGWPVAGIRLHIRQSQATDVTVNGKPLLPTAVYRIAMPDYIANGGDNMEMLRQVQQLNTGMLQREVMIDYLRKLHQRGNKLRYQSDNRVTAAHE